MLTVMKASGGFRLLLWLRLPAVDKHESSTGFQIRQMKIQFRDEFFAGM